jgi:hypothetical protein
MRILITGSRDWKDAGAVGIALYAAIEGTAHREVTVVHGACPTGADQMAAEFCESEAHWLEHPAGVSLIPEPHPADWKTFGKAAGFRRNAEMVALGADVCLAFVGLCEKAECRKPKPHGSHGAIHCASLAIAAGIHTEPFGQGAAELDALLNPDVIW